ncbi:MAG: hypothetical protein R2875_13995 [Desulfobacterales bacterium]
MDIPTSWILISRTEKGGVLYPAGYRFNPLEYTRYPKTIVVINGDDPAGELVFSIGPCRAFNTMILLSDGSYYDLAEKLERPVYYASTQIIKRLQLRAVPSVVRQSGKYLEVEEIALQNNCALCLLLCIAVFLLSVQAVCHSTFHNPLTEVCWHCMFPFKIAGVQVTCR